MNWCEYREFVVKNTKPRTKEWLKADVLNAGYDFVREQAQLRVFLYGSMKIKMLADTHGIESPVFEETPLDAELRNESIATVAASVARLDHMSDVPCQDLDFRRLSPVSDLLAQLECLEKLADPVANCHRYLSFLSCLIVFVPGVTLEHIIEVSVAMLTDKTLKALDTEQIGMR